MKLVKMSLAAAMLLSASAFAVDNVKISGDAKLFYSTTDDGTLDMFDQSASSADTALRLGVTADLVKGVSMGATAYAVSTLGLENNLVANTWTGAHAVGSSHGTNGNADVEDAAWMGELWIAGTVGKTTVKLGRMELDTPLAFSEKWSVAANTFDGAVLINQDLPDTTLVGAWVGKGNGVNALGADNNTDSDNNDGVVAALYNESAVGLDGFMAAGAKHSTFMSSGAYAAGLVNNSFKPATVQAWYYNVLDVADAYWLQADINCQLVKGATVGLQYALLDPKGLLVTHKDSEAFAAKLGYEGIQNLKVSVAYSDVDDEGTLKIANVATNNLGAAQSKLYTEAWWNYGYVSAVGAESYNVTAEYNAGFAKLAAYYTDVNNDVSNVDMTEVTVTASKSFGPLDVTLAYVNADVTGLADSDTVQAYLTLNF